MKKIIFLLLLIPFALSSRTLTSIGDGEWDDPTTWSLVSVPTSNDTVIIRSQDTVLVNCNCGVYDNVYLEIQGAIQFNNGKKLRFTNSTVQLIGEIFGGNPGTKLEIGSVSVYRGGSGSLYGPVRCDGVGCVSGSLPITLAFFEADLTLGNLNVRWGTLAEINNDYFDIEATTDGINWESYLRIDGAGNSTRFNNYAVNFPYDNQIGYVRLKQTDFDGTSTYSFIVFVQSSSFNVPRNDWLNVFNIKGQRVDFQHRLDPGMYIVQIESGYFKIIVE